MPPSKPILAAWLNQNNVGRAALALWFVVTLVALASLMLNHVVAMPKPDDPARLRKSISALRESHDRPFLLHVIYRDCSCTNNLFSHLIARKPFDQAEEKILFVGADAKKQLAAQQAGFGFKVVAASYLREEFGIEAAPLLLVSDPDGQMRYIGGYYNHPAAIHSMDEQIYFALQAGKPVESLPLFGCAVSDRLQAAVDPFGLVYPAAN